MARIKMGAPEAAVAVDPERAAIQAEAADSEAAIRAKMDAALAATKAKLAVAEQVAPPPDVTQALGAGFFGAAAVPVVPASLFPAAATTPQPVDPSMGLFPAPGTPVGHGVTNNVSISDGSASEEVTWTHGEELYGKQGTFSQYRVGPFTGKTKVRAGETHDNALERLKRELRAQADEERIAAHERFMSHWKKNIAGP